ncbi:MAG: glycosyltransferase family 2 protein [Flexilinea sp.]|nr:glycosyltransferase family 2 protein [Flexilinea sp.]
MVRISFVILTWNSEKVITACLESIAAMQLPGTEVILVDNGSSDGTRQKIEAFVSDHSGIPVRTVWLEKNYGTTISRNLGVKQADKDAEYICILDSDTVINRDAVTELTDRLCDDPKNAIAGPSMVNLAGEEQVTAKKIPTAMLKICKAFPLRSVQKIGERKEKYDFSENASAYPVGYLISACWMIKKGLMDKIGPLDEKIFYSPEDVEYCVRAWTKGYRVIYCPNAGIIHATQRISKKKLLSRHNWEHVKGLCYFFSKYGLFFSSAKINCK